MSERPNSEGLKARRCFETLSSTRPARPVERSAPNWHRLVLTRIGTWYRSPPATWLRCRGTRLEPPAAPTAIPSRKAFEEDGDDGACRGPRGRARRGDHADSPLDRRYAGRRARPAARGRSTTPRPEPRAVRSTSRRSRRSTPRCGTPTRRSRPGARPRSPSARSCSSPSASCSTRVARTSRRSSPPSTARCSRTRWARSRAGSR